MGICLLLSVSASVTILCILVSIGPVQTALIGRPESRIVGGEFASEGEFPHQVALLYREILLCGGSILTPDYILTAAHCVVDRDLDKLQIVSGRHDITEGFWEWIFGGISGLLPERFIIHPCYNESSSESRTSTFFNDIAIIKLDGSLTMGDDVKEIKIDDKDLGQDGVIAQAIGWGKTDGTDPNFSNSNRLKKANLTLNTKGFFTFMDIREGHLAASNPGMSICKGDSGGPLLCYDGNETNTNVVCGISSFTPVDCRGRSFFTRVFHYREWIKNVLNGDYTSDEGCIQKHTPPDIPPRTLTPDITSTTTANTTAASTTTFTQEPEPDDYKTSRGFPSSHPNYFFCEISLFLIFLSA